MHTPEPINPAPLTLPDSHAYGDSPRESSPYQKAILYALPRLGKHVYGGTVTPAEKTRRRAATKAQRVARRQNRSSK